MSPTGDGPEPSNLGPRTSGKGAHTKTKPAQLHGYTLWAKSTRAEENTTQDWTQGGLVGARACPWREWASAASPRAQPWPGGSC
jgi:hypothetical protein